MDWNLLGLSFITIFLSELGDKSQLATIALSGQGQSRKAIFFGTSSALVLASLLGALAGGAVSELIPTKILKALAALGFAILAIRLLFPGAEQESEQESEQALTE
ncbi:MAG: TMEM165/GDT1 family protein [Sphaerospermopsis sp. SIO1G2]|nr:TMEM165/GDT1 family protein [Sphaerospermopsis sp. SIO1G1]NET73419.1 TMEM165/GDT1 family protein [Sphaerospermopsis sp. SIO1G2]